MKLFNFLKRNKTRTDKMNSAYLLFGVFSSDNYTPYNIFKLTKDMLFVDRKGTWHSDRHTKKGYVFEGELLDESKFMIAKPLLSAIPFELMDDKWKSFDTTGNNNEDKLIVGFDEGNFQKSITIDSYEMETDTLPTAVKNFRLKVEAIITELNK